MGERGGVMHTHQTHTQTDTDRHRHTHSNTDTDTDTDTDTGTHSHALGTYAFASVSQVLAVEYIHDYGIVHRDLKPDNIIIGQNGARLLNHLLCFFLLFVFSFAVLRCCVRLYALSWYPPQALQLTSPFLLTPSL